MPTKLMIRPTVEVGLDTLSDTERAVAEEVLAAAKARCIAVAARDDDDDTTAIGRFLTRRPAETRAAVRARGRAITRQSGNQLRQEFGRHAVIVVDPTKGAKPIGKPKLQLPPEVIADLKAKIEAAKAAKAAAAADLAAGLAYNRMRMTITKVECVTDSDEWGSDEFSMGGEVIDPFLKVTKVDQFEVMTDADDGEVAHPNRVFADWKLHTGDGWPKAYVAFLTAAEKDDGGFADFLHDLWQEIGDEVTALVAAGVGALIGNEIVPGLGAIAGAVVGAIVGWLIGLIDNDDDVMQVRTLQMTLGAATKSYYDWAKLTTPSGWTHTTTFGEDGSHYKVHLAWHVYQA